MLDGRLSYAAESDGAAKRAVINALELALGRSAVESVFDRWKASVYGKRFDVYRQLLSMYDIRLKEIWPPSWSVTPEGPVLMVANHPFGVSDGMILGAIAESLGRPYRVLVNARMMKVPEFRPYILPIDFDATPEAVATNRATRLEAIRMLREGMTVGIFPSGGVATAPRGHGRAEELPWKLFLPKLVQAARANVLPIHIEGQNSLLFHQMSRVSQTARIALLFHEFRRQFGTTITVRCGNVLPWQELAALPDRQALLDHIRGAVAGMEPADAGRGEASIIRARRNHRLWKNDTGMTRLALANREAFR